MKVQEEIKSYIASQPVAKQDDMNELHKLIQEAMPACQLWFMDGTDATGKVVANPNIGYGFQVLKYADGKTRDFYQIGFSANKTGISLYVLGLDDKTYLAKTYAKKIGKATVTGYCIKFKALKDIDRATLQEAIKDGVEQTKPR